jgi:hypothetical protein
MSRRCIDTSSKVDLIPLAGQVFGNTNQMMDWTIASVSAGGDATPQFATSPQPNFYLGTFRRPSHPHIAYN